MTNRYTYNGGKDKDAVLTVSDCHMLPGFDFCGNVSGPLPDRSHSVYRLGGNNVMEYQGRECTEETCDHLKSDKARDWLHENGLQIKDVLTDRWRPAIFRGEEQISVGENDLEAVENARQIIQPETSL